MATMLAKLVDAIQYRDGQIQPVSGGVTDDNAGEVRDAVDEAGFEVVERGLKGWGEANAVIRSGEWHYLAVVAE